MTCDQIRQVDAAAIEKYGMPGMILMENAARGAAEVIDRIAPPGRIVILCGKGNNGGDGYAIARHLELADREVRIVAVAPAERLSGDAKTNAIITSHAGIAITVAGDRPETAASEHTIAGELLPAATVVDALLGTGAGGAPRGLFADLVRAANQSSALRIAIDIPTGLDGDSGQAADPTFRADHTLTFVAEKVGFKQADSEAFVGTVHVIDIGVPRKLLESLPTSGNPSS